MSFKVEIVADSKRAGTGERITSILATFPRYLLAEVNTHRAFSRNSASSRAIPFKKMVKSVMDNPYVPQKWMKDHPGMQGVEYLEESDEHWCKETWLAARDYAVQQATILNERYGATKQIANRLLEAYMWHTALITATDFENFFFLRANDAAEVNFQRLAFMMLESMNNSIPKELQPGQWHIPFEEKATEAINKTAPHLLTPQYGRADLVVKVATAMCARTSYTVVGAEDKPIDVAADVALAERLSTSGHWSPFEHIACAMNDLEYNSLYTTTYSGNFKGFVQYRKQFSNENAKDSRLIKK